MTVTSTTNRADFTGDGSTVAFAFTFKVFATTDVQVYVADVLQTITTHYTVALTGSPTGQTGGTVTFVTAPASSTAVALVRSLPQTQGINFPTAGAFPADSADELGDRAVMLVQELQNLLDKKAGLSPSSTLTPSLPTPSALSHLRWNAGATDLENVSVASSDTQAVITTEGDIIQGGTGGAAERLAFVAAEDILVGDTAKWKRIAKGAESDFLQINSGAVAWAPVGVTTTPAGAILMWITATAPSGWLLCDGTERNATTFESLFDVLVSDLTVWGTGTKTGDVTTDFATDDRIDLTSHGLAVDEVVHFTNTGGGLPGGLAINTKYYVITIHDANSFSVSTTKGGGTVDITSDGTGTHHVHETFALPDLRGRMPIMTGTGVGLTARTIAGTGGAETHQLTTAEMPSHTHTDNLRSLGATSGTEARAGTGALTGPFTTSSTGSDTAHENMSPFLAIPFIVKT